MKRMKLMSRCYFALLMMVLFAAPAFAYLDPGTLSYVISMIAGLFIAGGAAIAIFRRKIKLFFQNLGKKKQEGEQTVTETMDDVVNPMDDVVDPLAEDKQ
ncbi:MAG: hypothetical protein IJ206_02685 [Oscillospiraceae bacterium]|nr:hypothetical protein [Oscillospiraceae bacterium]